MKQRHSYLLYAALVIILASLPLYAQQRNHASGYKVPTVLPGMFQFVDRIQRPCASGTTPIASVIVNPNGTSGNVAVTTCQGGSLTVNGTAITPGAGLSDPGSNGYVVRTALNTTVARTLTVSAPITVTNSNGVAGNTLLACPTCVTSAAALTNTAIMTGAGLQASQTPAATATLSAAGNLSTPGSVTTGNAGGTTGSVALSGATSGTVTITTKAAAGTWTATLPDTAGSPNQFLQTDGTGVLAWAAAGGGGTPGGADTNVQFNDGGAFGGDAGLTYNKTTDTLTVAGQYFTTATITAGGTTGNQTINNSAGSVNFAAAATSLVVTSNKVTANSIVMCTIATNDATLKSVQCVPTAGSFTMFGNAAATAETRVNFWVLNQ